MNVPEAVDASHDVFRVQFEPQPIDSMTVEDAKRIMRGVLRSVDRTDAYLTELASSKPRSVAEQLETRAKRAAQRVDYESLLPRKESALQNAQNAVERAQIAVDEAQRVFEARQRALNQIKPEADEAERANAAESLRTAGKTLRSAQKQLNHVLGIRKAAERSLNQIKNELSNDQIAFSRVLSAAIQSSDVSDLAVKTAETVSQNGSATKSEITAANREAARATERTASLSLRAAKLAAKLVENEASAIQAVTERNAQEVGQRMKREGELQRLRQRRSKAKRLSDDLAKWAAVKKANADEFAAKCKTESNETDTDLPQNVETGEIEDVAGSFDVDNLRSEFTKPDHR